MIHHPHAEELERRDAPATLTLTVESTPTPMGTDVTVRAAADAPALGVAFRVLYDTTQVSLTSVDVPAPRDVALVQQQDHADSILGSSHSATPFPSDPHIASVLAAWMHFAPDEEAWLKPGESAPLLAIHFAALPGFGGATVGITVVSPPPGLDVQVQTGQPPQQAAAPPHALAQAFHGPADWMLHPSALLLSILESHERSTLP